MGRRRHHPVVDQVAVGGAVLCYEVLGKPEDPAFLLISGLSRQLIGWDEAFCQLLVAEGYRAVRFDNRDSGRSTSFDGGPPFDMEAARRGGRDAVAYTLDDMADDAAGLLDALGIARAHVVGTSMGGMIAQALAVRHPAKVWSLCSIMSTTGATDVGRPTPQAMAVVMQRPPTDRASYLATELANQRIIGSRGDLVDEEWRRGRFERFYDRGLNPAGTSRQIMAIVASGDRTAALAKVAVPTVVIHGDADPLVPPSGGEATAGAIPGAQLVVFAGMGHEMPPVLWPRIVEAMVANARRAEHAALLAPPRGSPAP